MGCLSRLFDWLLKTLCFILLVLMYLLLLTSNIFAAKSNYLSIYYIVIMLIPPSFAAFIASDDNVAGSPTARVRNQICRINGVVFWALLIVCYFFFWGIIGWPSIIWVFITSAIFGLHHTASVALNPHAPSFGGTVLRIITLTIAALLFLLGEGQRFSDLKHPDAAQADIYSLNGVSELTKEAMKHRADVVVESKAYLSNRGDYYFYIMPICESYFSRPAYVIQGNADSLNQLVGEIRLVSAVNNRGGRIGSFFNGILQGAWGIVKGVFSLIFHPIQTGEGLVSFVGSVFATAIHEPYGLVERPFTAFNEHLEGVDTELAREYGVDIKHILLPETCEALTIHKWWGFAGKATTEIATFVVPAVKLSELKFLPKVSEAGAAAKLRAVTSLEKHAIRLTKAEAKQTEMRIVREVNPKPLEARVRGVKNENIASSSTARDMAESNPKTMNTRSAKENLEGGAEKKNPKDNRTAEENAGGEPKDVRGKKDFYPKAKESLEKGGYKYMDGDKDIKGMGKSHSKKPDYVATKDDTTYIGEIKSPAEPPTSTSWRNRASPNESDEFSKVRSDVKAREASGLVDKSVGGHEIIIKGQIRDYEKNIGKTWELPAEAVGKKLGGAYTVPAEEAEHVIQALKNSGIEKYEIVKDSSGVVTFLFEFPK